MTVPHGTPPSSPDCRRRARPLPHGGARRRARPGTGRRGDLPPARPALPPRLCPRPNRSSSCTQVQSQDASASAPRGGRETIMTPLRHSTFGLCWGLAASVFGTLTEAAGVGGCGRRVTASGGSHGRGRPARPSHTSAALPERCPHRAGQATRPCARQEIVNGRELTLWAVVLPKVALFPLLGCASSLVISEYLFVFTVHDSEIKTQAMYMSPQGDPRSPFLFKNDRKYLVCNLGDQNKNHVKF